MRNSRVLRESLATFSPVLCCGFFAGLLAQPMFGADEPPSPPFACEVRYHFREQFNNPKPGEKRFSAPSYEREPLPMSRVTISNGLAARIVEGRVAHLPYQFLVKIGQSRDSKVATLEINVLDSSGKPLAGFPQVIPKSAYEDGRLKPEEIRDPCY